MEPSRVDYFQRALLLHICCHLEPGWILFIVTNVEDLKQNETINIKLQRTLSATTPASWSTQKHTREGGAHISMSVSVSRAASLVAGCLQWFNPTWHSPKYLFPLAEFTAKEFYSHVHIKLLIQEKILGPNGTKRTTLPLTSAGRMLCKSVKDGA